MSHDSNKEPVAAIVVAAGSGVRLGGGTPKALRPVAGRTLVARSVGQLAAGGCTTAVVVIADGLQPDFAEALTDSPIPVRFALGGAERQDSVRAGIDALDDLPDSTIVLVHDAARAFVPADVVERVIAAVREDADAVIPVVPVVDTVRRMVGDDSVPADRSELRAVQTPQGFRISTLTAAHRRVQEDGVSVTDDASACEYAGYQVTLVQGDREAMKVTEPLDLVIAEALAAKEK
jgi:2-C-methyl-D-erythritol 4-phosphate cytidylyltransferase